MQKKLMASALIVAGIILGLQGVHHNATAQATPSVAGQMTIEQIGSALDKYGKNTINSNGQTIYSLNIARDKWTINVIVSLSPNHGMIWMTNNLISIPDEAKASPTGLSKLLEKNSQIGPMFFSIFGSDHSVRISNPVPNYNLTATSVQNQVDALVQTVLDTATLWSTDALTPGGQQPAPSSPFFK